MNSIVLFSLLIAVVIIGFVESETAENPDDVTEQSSQDLKKELMDDINDSLTKKTQNQQNFIVNAIVLQLNRLGLLTTKSYNICAKRAIPVRVQIADSALQNYVYGLVMGKLEKSLCTVNDGLIEVMGRMEYLAVDPTEKAEIVDAIIGKKCDSNYSDCILTFIKELREQETEKEMKKLTKETVTPLLSVNLNRLKEALKRIKMFNSNPKLKVYLSKYIFKVLKMVSVLSPELSFSESDVNSSIDSCIAEIEKYLNEDEKMNIRREIKAFMADSKRFFEVNGYVERMSLIEYGAK